jgi:hypothetical protein
MTATPRDYQLDRRAGTNPYGIILADLDDEVAESKEEALELPTDKEQLVDRKRLGGDSSPK